MQRPWFALGRSRQWSRIPFPRIAVMGFSMGTLGIWYISRHHIHADTPDSRSPYNNNDEPVPQPDALFEYVRDTAGGHGFIQGNTGISRFDYLSIPKSVCFFLHNHQILIQISCFVFVFVFVFFFFQIPYY